MDKKPQEQLLDKIINQTKPAALKLALGEWAEQSLREQTPLTAETLASWGAQAGREASTRMVIEDFLLEIKTE